MKFKYSDIPDDLKFFYNKEKEDTWSYDANMLIEHGQCNTPEYLKLVEWWNQLKEDKDKKGYLVTINPKDDVPLDRFVNRVERSMKKKWIKKSSWCFEWRKNDTGLHAHAVIEHGKKRFSEIKREFLNTFKTMIGNEMHINIKYINDKISMDRTINYLKGIKKGNKKSNFDEDIKNRKKYNLEDIYTNEQI